MGNAVLDGDELLAIERSLCRRYVEIHRTEPEHPSTSFDDDVLEFGFHGGLSAVEEALRVHRDDRRLRDARERSLVVTGAQLAIPVEELARSQVGFHVGFFDVDEVETKLLFGFEGAYPPTRDPRVLASWAAEMREKARVVRQEGADVRHASRELRLHFRRLRSELAERRANS